MSTCYLQYQCILICACNDHFVSRNLLIEVEELAGERVGCIWGEGEKGKGKREPMGWKGDEEAISLIKHVYSFSSSVYTRIIIMYS